MPVPACHPQEWRLLQVYAGNVLYEHEMSPEPFWEAHDAIELLLSSPPAPDVAATLAVTISFEAACPQLLTRLWRNKGEKLMNWQGWGAEGRGPKRRETGQVSSSYYSPQGLESYGKGGLGVL